MIVDDHQVLLDGIKALFDNDEQVDICCEALTGTSAVELALSNEINVILLDINMPDKNGFDVCKAIKAEKADVKIIALTMHNEAAYISKMIKMGVDGYLLKTTSREEMLLAIETVMKGERYLSKDASSSLIDGMHRPSKPKTSDFIQKLTRREKEVLRLVVDEKTTDEIATELFIGKTTVISHRKNLLRKLNAKNTAGLVRAAFQFGLLNE